MNTDTDDSAAEQFKPLPHLAPTTPLRKLVFYLRLCLDLQIYTVTLDIQRFARQTKGIIVDVGCGDCVWNSLLDKTMIQYFGLDIPQSDHFGYHNTTSQKVTFDGEHIPFDDAGCDAVLCTEVLEHIADPSQLIAEIGRILKPGGKALITIPWSARVHFKPYDFKRYTPYALQLLFKDFSHCGVSPRGNDIAVIASKMIVVLARNAGAVFRGNIAKIITVLFLMPFVLLALLCAHVSIFFGWGSKDDPLGYTIICTK